MAEIENDKIIKEEIKEEAFENNVMVSFKDEVITPSTVEDTCTVYVQEEDVKMENSGDEGIQFFNLFVLYRVSQKKLN